MDPESWNCRKKRRMPIRKRYVSVITGSRYWKICFWSLKSAEENETGASGDGKALYFAREKKGHEGVKGTVTEDYQGILVHDHDRIFYNYGTDHQECLAPENIFDRVSRIFG